MSGVERRVDFEAIAIQRLLALSGIVNPETGEPFSAPMVFGLGGGIGMMLFVFEYQDHLPSVGMITRYHTKSGGYTGFSSGALSRAGGTVTFRQSGSSSVSAKNLLNALSDQRAALCWIDRAALPEAALPSVFGQLSPWLVVATSSAANGLTSLFDPAMGEIDVETASFAAARQAFKPLKQQLATISPGDQVESLRARIRAAVNSTSRNMLTPEMTNFGLPALKKWTDLLTNQADKRGWSRLLTTGKSHSMAMASIYLAISAGGAANRSGYADFLEEAGNLLRDGLLLSQVEAFRRSARHWDELAKTALPDHLPPLTSLRRAIDQRFELESRSMSGTPVFAELRANCEQLNAMCKSPVDDQVEIRQQFAAMADIVHKIEVIERVAMEHLSTWSATIA